MQPTNREDYLAEQSRELDVWNKKVGELELQIAARPKVPEPLRERVSDLTDSRDRVVRKLAEVAQMSLEEWKGYREAVEAAWEDLRVAWNHVVVLLGRSAERV